MPGTCMPFLFNIVQGPLKLKKNENWSTLDLTLALVATDNDLPVKTPAILHNILVTNVRDHLFGKSMERRRGRAGILTAAKDDELIEYILKMQRLGHLLSLIQYCMKVAKITQCRPTPFTKGVLGYDWIKWFKKRHPKLTLHVAQGLEHARAKGLCPKSVQSFYTNLEKLYAIHHYSSSRTWICNESGA
jgi:hypothetical protein